MATDTPSDSAYALADLDFEECAVCDGTGVAADTICPACDGHGTIPIWSNL